MIAVQTISTSWTKSSRGGMLATMRSRVPKQLPLNLPSDFSNLVWHSISYSERNKFMEPFAVKVSTSFENNRFGCRNAEIQLQDNSATLIYRYQSGAPVRRFFDKTGTYVAPEHLIAISRNSWASIEYNDRLTCIDTGNWWYEHVIVNVAVGDNIPANVFLTTQPIEHYTQLAHLR
jgi:hypothetical protein